MSLSRVALGALAALCAVCVVSANIVCVFDIDQTLTRQPLATAQSCNVSALAPGSDLRLPAAYASQGLDACFNAGYFVGIATAEPGAIAKATEGWLTELSGNRFNSSFFASPAFGYGASDKTNMLTAIKNYYGVPAQCVVMFDDQQSNVDTANGLGMTGQLTSAECGGHNSMCMKACGVSQYEFEAGMAVVKARCQQARVIA